GEGEGWASGGAEATRAAEASYEQLPADPGPPHCDPPTVSAESSRAPAPPLTDEAFHEDSYVPPGPQTAAYDDDDVYTRRPPRSYSGIIKLAALLAVLVGIVGITYLQRHNISSLVGSFRSQPS